MARRLLKEHADLQRDASSSPDLSLTPLNNNLYTWSGFVTGPAETPYAGGRFELSVTVPETYPLYPPVVKFTTRLFHPNVHAKTGEICLDILKNAWSPVWTLQSTLRAIRLLLAHPEPGSPLNCDAGNLLRAGDTRGYRSVAGMYTRLYAMEGGGAGGDGAGPSRRV